MNEDLLIVLGLLAAFVVGVILIFKYVKNLQKRKDREYKIAKKRRFN